MVIAPQIYSPLFCEHISEKLPKQYHINSGRRESSDKHDFDTEVW